MNLTIIATNAAGDTATEFIQLVYNDAPPILILDRPGGNAFPADRSGNFTISGVTNPGQIVVATGGYMVTADVDGVFSISGKISGNVGDSADVVISATNIAGNSTRLTVSVEITDAYTGGNGGTYISPLSGGNDPPQNGDTQNNTSITASPYGKITISPSNPATNDKVTVTVTDNGNGTFSYIQPSGKITISATYKPIICTINGISVSLTQRADGSVSLVLSAEDMAKYLIADCV
jgi:hypothetical protein